MGQFFRSVQVCIAFAITKIRDFYLINGMVIRVHLIQSFYLKLPAK